LKILGTFESFTISLKDNNESIELLNSFQKFVFDKQSAARGPPCYATVGGNCRFLQVKPRICAGGAKIGEISFFPLETKKTTFSLKI